MTSTQEGIRKTNLEEETEYRESKYKSETAERRFVENCKTGW